jgi:WD40 repeat protein
MKEIINLLPERKEYCILIKSAFSDSFCDNIIAQNKDTFKVAKTHYPTSYRNNERQLLDNSPLSIQLFESIKQYIPNVISIEGISEKERGNWQLDKLNSTLRICRYLPNQYFNKHTDGIYFESEIKQSKLTFMIYLNGNEAFENGRTLFFNSKDDDAIIGSYEPEKGDLIIFDHNLWHSGEEVTSGEKYILRSDIIYHKIGEKNTNSNAYCSEGHLGYIWTAALLNEQLVTGGRDKTIKIWSKQGNKIDELKGHNNSILKLIAFDNKTIISASRDMYIKIWQQGNDHFFELKKSIKLHQGAVLSLCKINDSQFLSGGADGVVNQIDINGNLIKTYQAHNEWIWYIARINEGYYATISEDGSMVIWNNNHEIITKWKTNCPINSIVVENENTIFIGQFDDRITKLNLDIKQKKLIERTTKKCHNGIIRSLKIDEHLLYSASEDNLVKVWQKDTFDMITSFKHHNFVQDIVLQKESFISVSYDGEIRKKSSFSSYRNDVKK